MPRKPRVGDDIEPTASARPEPSKGTVDAHDSSASADTTRGLWQGQQHRACVPPCEGEDHSYWKGELD